MVLTFSCSRLVDMIIRRRKRVLDVFPLGAAQKDLKILRQFTAGVVDLLTTHVRIVAGVPEKSPY
jgi:hypothetical protein